MAVCPRADSMTWRTVGSSASGWLSSSSCTTAWRSATQGRWPEQVGHRVQWVEVHQHDLVAQGPQEAQARPRRRRSRLHPKQGPAARPRSRPARSGPGLEVAEGVGRVGAFHHAQHGGGVVERERKDRHAVQAAAGRHHTRGAHPASVGLSPTRLLKPAGTRPEPAVSVPSEKATSPRATTTAEPSWSHR